MAERNKTGAEAGGSDGAAAGEAPVEKGPVKKGRFLMILLPLILLGGGGGGYLAYSQYVTLATLGQETEVVEEEAPIEYGEFLELDNLIVNPARSDGKRFLMIKIGLESDEPKALDEIVSKKVVIHDTILDLLSAKPVEDLASIERRESIKEEIREALNEILTEGDVTRLYFTQYVLQ
jgi:flagellar FliL protein